MLLYYLKYIYGILDAWTCVCVYVYMHSTFIIYTDILVSCHLVSMSVLHSPSFIHIFCFSKNCLVDHLCMCPCLCPSFLVLGEQAVSFESMVIRVSRMMLNWFKRRKRGFDGCNVWWFIFRKIKKREYKENLKRRIGKTVDR